MDWFTGTIVFLLIWWVAIFCVLPFGLRRDETGKPERVYIGRTVLITTVITALLWGVMYLLIDSGIISFREMAASKAAESKEL